MSASIWGALAGSSSRPAAPPAPPPHAGPLLGLGVDLLSLSRMQRLLARRPEFMLPLVDPEERAYLEAEASPDARLLVAAQLWTGKEAVAKALGTGVWQQGVAWHELGLRSSGEVTLSGGAALAVGPSIIRWQGRRRGGHQVAYAWRWRRELTSPGERAHVGL